MTTPKDYSDAPFYAISGIGYGKGYDEQEARRNYTTSQLRNIPAEQTVFKTRTAFRAALNDGEMKPEVYRAPEGATGFVTGADFIWTFDDGHTEPVLLAHKVPTPMDQAFALAVNWLYALSAKEAADAAWLDAEEGSTEDDLEIQREQETRDQLVDHLEANDLNGCPFDPRDGDLGRVRRAVADHGAASA